MFPSTATPITVQHSASHLKSAFRSTPRQTPQRLSGATHSRPSGIYDTSTNPLTFFLVQVSAFSDQVLPLFTMAGCSIEFQLMFFALCSEGGSTQITKRHARSRQSASSVVNVDFHVPTLR